MKSLILFLLCTISISAMAESLKLDLEPQNSSDGLIMTADITYDSRLSRNQLDLMINPATGRFQDFFADEVSLTKLGSNRYSSVVPTKKFGVTVAKLTSVIDYSMSESGSKSVHTFSFGQFSSIFKSSVTKIEISETQEGSKIRYSLRSVIKPEAWKNGFIQKEVKNKTRKNLEAMIMATKG